MRRLARHVFTVVSALSLLLCVAVCVLWVRSYRVTDVVSDNGITLLSPATSLASNRGRIALDHLGPLASWTGPGIKANGEIGGIAWFWSPGGQASPPAPARGVFNMRPQWIVVAPHWF